MNNPDTEYISSLLERIKQLKYQMIAVYTEIQLLTTDVKSEYISETAIYLTNAVNSLNNAIDALKSMEVEHGTDS